MRPTPTSLVAASVRRPWLTLAIGLVLTLGALFVNAQRMAMTTDTAALISSSVEWRQQGLDAPLARRFLATVAEVEAVHADNLRAHRLGINGVPCFVVADRSAIAGAQEPEVLERLLDIALVES